MLLIQAPIGGAGPHWLVVIEIVFYFAFFALVPLILGNNKK